ncbi:hypothetical protein SEA_REDFOX_67 [Arthrobacter phage RedFox]|nr:hypothetical protein SEA_REDFOX_67 [Arthrobacter phage RedFox]
MRAWLCRIGWHGWDTWVTLAPGRVVVRRVCSRAGCGVEEWWG